MQGLKHALGIQLQKWYLINFTKKNTKFCLSSHYNGANSYLFVNGTEIIKFKANSCVFIMPWKHFKRLDK